MDFQLARIAIKALETPGHVFVAGGARPVVVSIVKNTSLIAAGAGVAVRATVRTLIPLGLAMSALDWPATRPIRNKPSELAFIALEEEHLVGHGRLLVQSDAGITPCDGAVGAPWDHVFALLAPTVSHIVLFVAEAGALLVLVHVWGTRPTFADSIFDSEETTCTGDAEITVPTLETARYLSSTTFTIALIHIVAF